MTNLHRDNAIALARHAPKKAVERARAIANPLYRGDALATIACVQGDGAVSVKLIEEAVTALRKVDDPFDRAFGLCRPIAAFVEIGKKSPALAVINEAVSAAGALANPTSKANALFQVWQAAASLGANIPTTVTAALCNACAGAGQKGQEHMRDAALMLGEAAPDSARSIIGAMVEGRYKRQAERRLGERQFMKPRRFVYNKDLGNN